MIVEIRLESRYSEQWLVLASETSALSDELILLKGFLKKLALYVSPGLNGLRFVIELYSSDGDILRTEVFDLPR